MPAIQVYKHNSVMIPIDDAKKAKAYICPWTNQLYASKRGYLSHLKKLRVERMHKRARDLRHNRKLEEMWNQPDFDSVIKWIHNNPEVFWRNAKRRGWTADETRWDKIRDTFEVKVTGLKLRYDEFASNSHGCPHNGVTNWDGRDILEDGTPAPRGYPGFRGRIELYMPVEPLSFSSNVFEGTRIHTGTGGGGGGGRYGYDVTFFLDDWPGIAAEIYAEKEKHVREGLLSMIENKYKPYVVDGYNYGKIR